MIGGRVVHRRLTRFDKVTLVAAVGLSLWLLITALVDHAWWSALRWFVPFALLVWLVAKRYRAGGNG